MDTRTQGDEWHLPKGSVIFRQGDDGNEMFVIAAGRVRLTLGTGGHEKEVALLGRGDFFGELSLLGTEPRSATAVAAEDSTLLAIGRDVFAMLVKDDLEIVSRIMNTQGERLRQTNQPIEDLTQRLGRIRISAHCLQRLVGPNAQLPLTVDAQQLARELAASPEAVHATLTDMARRGAGSLQGQQWSINGREQVDKLIETLCAYAEAGAA